MKKIISGFQTGVDIAAIIAAEKNKIETGGTIPKGFRTQEGSRSEYATRYNAKECCCSFYQHRTELNVKDSDATVRIAADWRCTGTALTGRLILKHDKPNLDISLNNLNDKKEELINFLKQYDTINFAGNSEKSAPGIQLTVETFLTEVFKNAR
jgi:hypothetical protein